ncbi:MAG TPA: VOC family protein [Propionibacteriaceae bacterium]
MPQSAAILASSSVGSDGSEDKSGPSSESVFVSVRGTDADEITAYWNGLSEDATIAYDLAPAGWSPLYGMLKDRFGVIWVLDVIADYTAS